MKACEVGSPVSGKSKYLRVSSWVPLYLFFIFPSPCSHRDNSLTAPTLSILHFLPLSHTHSMHRDNSLLGPTLSILLFLFSCSNSLHAPRQLTPETSWWAPNLLINQPWGRFVPHICSKDHTGLGSTRPSPATEGDYMAPLSPSGF